MQLVIMNSSQSVEREIENIYTLGRQKADAIILFGGVITDAHMTAIKKVNIPVIVLGQAVEGVHSLVHDEAHAGESMGRYITASGHQRILLLGVTRTNWRTGEKESRRVELTEPLTELRLFMEESFLEVFVNQGQECFSLRYIALASDKSLSYHEDTSTANNEWTIYSLSGFTMEKLLGSF